MIGPEEVEECIKKRTDAININALLLDTNRPKGNKCSRLNQEVTASDLPDIESIANLELPDKFTDLSSNQLFEMLNAKAKTDLRGQKARKQAFKSNSAKRANLPNKMFDYIYTTKCQHLFSLAWYDNQTYVLYSQTLPTLCSNSLSCNSEPPNFLNRFPFIDDTPFKLLEINREWVAYRASELKTWRAEKSKAYWLEEKIMTNIPDTLLMSDICLLALVKNGNELDNESKIRDFLQPWPEVDKFATDILACFQQSIFNGQTIPSKAKKKVAL